MVTIYTVFFYKTKNFSQYKPPALPLPKYFFFEKPLSCFHFTGIRPEHVTLQFNGNHLSDPNLFLYEAGLTDGCTVIFQQRLAHEGQQNFNQPESSEPQNDLNQRSFEKRF